MNTGQTIISIGKNLVLTGSSAFNLVRRDPALFLIQVCRRFLMRQSNQLYNALSQRSVWSRVAPQWQATLAFLADQPTIAKKLLADPSSKGGKIADHIRVQLGLAPVGGNATLWGRYYWKQGQVEQALAVCPTNGSLRRMLSDEWQIMQPGFRLSVSSSSLDRSVLTLLKIPAPGKQGKKLSVPANRKAPRVLHFLTNSFPYTQSGYSIRSHDVLTLHKNFSQVLAVTRLAYPVTIGHIKATAKQQIDQVKYLRLLPWRLPPTKLGRLNRQAKMLSKLVTQLKPDYLHTTTNYENALVVEAVARHFHLPWVYEMRGELENTWLSRFPLEQQTKAKESPYYQALRGQETSLAASATAVVCLSQTQKTGLIQRGINPEKIFVVPNSADPKWLNYPDCPPAQARAELGLDRQGHWVGAASALVEYEGFETLLRAVARVRSQGHDLRLLLVGDGTSRPSLQKLAEKLAIADYCHLVGRKKYDQVAKWVQCLDAFVIPRIDVEVCRNVTPIKPLVAMAMSRPIIASDLPALKEICGQGRLGTLFPAGDVVALAKCLVRIVEDDKTIMEKTKQAKQEVAQRTWENQVSVYQNLARYVMGKEEKRNG